MIERELQKYFDFDESDLFTNRLGKLTSNQRKRLEGDARFARKLFLIAGIVILVIAIFPSIILFLRNVPRTFFIIFSVVWTPVWTFIGIKLIRTGRPKKEDFALKCVEGEVNIIKENRRNSTSEQYEDTYELHIGGVAFDVDSDLANIMMQGDNYAIYYIEGTKSIMSAEMINSGDQET